MTLKNAILGSDQPECGGFFNCRQQDNALPSSINPIGRKAPHLGRLKAKAPPLVGPCWHLSGYGAFCIMETCNYCGRRATTIRTYDGVRMHVCYDCTIKRVRQKANEARQRYRGGAKLRKAVIKERGYRCEWCGSTEGEIHMHHKVRLMDGGKHTRENVVLLCVSCHGKAHKNGTRW